MKIGQKNETWIKTKMLYTDLLEYYYAPSVRPKRINTRIQLISKTIEILRQRQNSSCFSVLDVGCGNCDLLLLLRRFGAKELIGVNLFPLNAKAFRSEEMVENLFNEGIKYADLDVDREKLPIPSRSINVVLLIDVLEHLYDPDFALKEISRVTKNNGILVIRTPNASNFKRRWLYKHRNLLPKYKERKFHGHIGEYTTKELKFIASLYGFEPVFIKQAPTEYVPNVPKIFLKIYNLFEHIVPAFAYENLMIATKIKWASNG